MSLEAWNKLSTFLFSIVSHLFCSLIIFLVFEMEANEQNWNVLSLYLPLFKSLNTRSIYVMNNLLNNLDAFPDQPCTTLWQTDSTVSNWSMSILTAIYLDLCLFFSCFLIICLFTNFQYLQISRNNTPVFSRGLSNFDQSIYHQAPVTSSRSK
jgi:hypothetical protein